MRVHILDKTCWSSLTRSGGRGALKMGDVNGFQQRTPPVISAAHTQPGAIASSIDNEPGWVQIRCNPIRVACENIGLRQFLSGKMSARGGLRAAHAGKGFAGTGWPLWIAALQGVRGVSMWEGGRRRDGLAQEKCMWAEEGRGGARGRGGPKYH